MVNLRVSDSGARRRGTERFMFFANVFFANGCLTVLGEGVLEGATRFLWLFPHAKVMGKAA